MTTRIPAPALSLTDTLRQRDAQIQRLKDSLLDEMKGRQDAIEEAAKARAERDAAWISAERNHQDFEQAYSSWERLKQNIVDAEAIQLESFITMADEFENVLRLFQLANAAKREYRQQVQAVKRLRNALYEREEAK